MYGHFPGQQEQQPPSHQPFNYQTTPNLQPPYIGTPQQNLPFAGNHTVTNLSYEQNANRIPGLAFGVSPPLPTPSYRSEIKPSWPQFPSTTSPNHASSQVQTVPSFQPQAKNRPYEYSIQGHAGQAPLQQPITNPLEEGELSEGEFEDLYEPREPGGTIRAQQRSPPLRAYGLPENRVSSASDADESSIYNIGSPREEPVVESTSTSMPLVDDGYYPEDNRQPAAPQRERSGSYSPYLSPSELQRKASVTQATIKDSKSAHSIARPNSRLPRKPDQAPPKGNQLRSRPASHNKAPTSTGAMDTSNCNSSLQSIPEAKKKAQEAILGLWPLKIRYQNYIDEGFDESLIKSLFTDLGLDVSTSKPNIPTNKQSNESRTAEDISSKSAQPSKSNLLKPDLDNKSAPNGAKIDEVKMGDKPAKSAAEERKDKIARKLAAKAQKTTAIGPTPSAKPLPPTSSLPSAPSLPAVTTGSSSTVVNATINLKSSAPMDSPTPAGPSPAKPKTRAENNALLHQKLAALKKKEQEKAAAAQAGAAKESTIPVQTTTTPTQPLIVRTNSTPAVSINQPQHTSSASSQPASVTGDSSRRSVSAQPQPQRQPLSTSKDVVVSGLSLPVTQPAQAKPRSLKRPVASDFDNYSTHTSMLKRTRTQETLIIDVSDDEDVEMDIGSPTDGPATSIQTANPPGRQTPLAAFPPLSDPTAWKQRSSPASAAAAQVPEKAGKLDFLHERIEEMKRKIAEAEAKKKYINNSSAPQTPSTQSPPPAEPLRLPKASDSKELIRRVGFERRNRIASVDLPAVEAALKEKRDRLREVVSQAAQLELDLQAAEAERQQLATEMKELGESSEGDTTESSGQPPAFGSFGMCRGICP